MADGSANLVALMDAACDWESAVTPLSWSEVVAAWAACAREHALPHADDGAYLAHLISVLADNHRLHLVDGIFPGRDHQVWPMAAAQVVTAADAALLVCVHAALRPLAQLVGTVGSASDTSDIARTLTYGA